MAKPSGKVLVQVELKPETAKQIADSVTAEGLTDISKLSGVCAGLMDQLAEGGIMLDEKDVQRLRDTGHNIEDAGDIVDMAEQGVGYKNGQFTIAAEIDPQELPALQALADSNGVSLNDMGTQMMAYAIDQGWLYEVPAGYRSVRLTPESNKMIAEITGLPQDFSGEQLARWLREQILGIVEEEPPVSLEPEEVQS